VVVGHQLPVAYVSDGQRVPEDLQPARPNNLIMRAASLMQQHGEKPAEEELAVAFGRVGNGHG
jgi:flagellar biosynthesis protein FlhF